MYKKTVTYEDYNGNERTEDFYFNLNEAELTDMEFSTEGGLADRIKRIVDSKDIIEINKLFKEIFHKSYGEKSADGRRFIKNQELTESFMDTPAYSKIYVELLSDSEAAADFINSILPKDLRDKVKSLEANK